VPKSQNQFGQSFPTLSSFNNDSKQQIMLLCDLTSELIDEITGYLDAEFIFRLLRTGTKLLRYKLHHGGVTRLDITSATMLQCSRIVFGLKRFTMLRMLKIEAAEKRWSELGIDLPSPLICHLPYMLQSLLIKAPNTMDIFFPYHAKNRRRELVNLAELLPSLISLEVFNPNTEELPNAFLDVLPTSLTFLSLGTNILISPGANFAKFNCLESLELQGGMAWETGNEVPQFPSSLRKLILLNMLHPKIFAAISNIELEILDVPMSTSITTECIMMLPKTITIINLPIGILEYLPQDPWDMNILNYLPPRLKRLSVAAIPFPLQEESQSMLNSFPTTVSWLPPTLQSLHFGQTSLPDYIWEHLPSSLIELSFEGIGKQFHKRWYQFPRFQTSFPKLLKFHYHENGTSPASCLCMIPPSVRYLELGTLIDSLTLSLISHLPSHLLELRLRSKCQLQPDVFAKFPSSLLQLHVDIINTTLKPQFAMLLPPNLLTFDCKASVEEESLRVLPKHLTSLEMNHILDYTDDTIPHLPRGLTSLRLLISSKEKSGVTNACLPNLPRSLKTVRLKGKFSMQDLDKIPFALEFISDPVLRFAIDNFAHRTLDATFFPKTKPSILNKG
jgi:hypothetical protein